MNTVQVLIIVALAIIVFFLILLIAVPALKRRGVNVPKILDWTLGLITAADTAFDTIKPFLPATPGIFIFDKILSMAAVGVCKAEQLYHVGELEGDQRKQEAEAYILDALKISGIEITPEVQKLVDGAIESHVFNLGHKTKETTDNTVQVTSD